MHHDFSIVFDTESPLWQKVLDIFEKNEKFLKKIVKNRNLHHKFPRSFSKKFGEAVDNDPDNLISLSPADHFLVHYYYYKIAKKGYRSSMALAFRMMARDKMKTISPETAEAIARDFELAKIEIVPGMKGKQASEETKLKMRIAKIGKKRKPFSEETKRKMSEKAKGRIISNEQRKKMSETVKNKVSDEFRERMRKVHIGKHWKLVNGVRTWY